MNDYSHEENISWWLSNSVGFEAHNVLTILADREYTGTWSLQYSTDIVFYDDGDEPAPDNTYQLVFDDNDEELLYLLINFKTDVLAELSHKWRVRGFTSKTITLSCNETELLLTKMDG